MLLSAHKKTHLTFPAQYVEMVESIVRARGGNTDTIYQRCGIDADAIKQPHSRVSLTVFEQLMNITKENTLQVNEPASLQILRHMPITIHGLTGLVVLTSDNLSDALDAALRYFPLILPCAELSKMLIGDQVCVSLNLSHDFGSPINECFTEVIFGIILNMVKFSELEQHKENPDHLFRGLVSFRHADTGYGELLSKNFNIAIKFSALSNHLLLPRRLLNSPLLTRSPGTRTIIEALLEKNLHALQWQNNIVVQVKEQLFAFTKEDYWPSADQIAENLLISARTLSRRLAENGYTLTALMEEVRMEKADILLMSSTLPIIKVAHKLGYSDISTFSRAYKRVRKINPSEVRHQLRTNHV